MRNTDSDRPAAGLPEAAARTWAVKRPPFDVDMSQPCTLSRKRPIVRLLKAMHKGRRSEEPQKDFQNFCSECRAIPLLVLVNRAASLPEERGGGQISARHARLWRQPARSAVAGRCPGLRAVRAQLRGRRGELDPSRRCGLRGVP